MVDERESRRRQSRVYPLAENNERKAVRAFARVPGSSTRIHVASRVACSAGLAPQAFFVGTVASRLKSKHRSSILSSDLNSNEFSAFYASALAGYPKYPSVLNATSKRVRVPARLNNQPVDHITIDTACDIPCISAAFMRRHDTLKDADILPVPPGVINLRSADNSPLKIKGYTRFKLTLGDITLPVEALVLPSLGPDNMLLDNSIMGAFGGVLDWQAEELSFKKSNHTVKATHRKSRSPTKTTADTDNCSVVALDGETEPVPVYLSKRCTVPARHEKALEVYTHTPPDAETVTALIEPRIVTSADITKPDTPKAFHRVVVARPVCPWSNTKGAMVQVANPSNRVAYLPRNTLLGYISPVKTVLPQTVSSTNTNPDQTAKHRADLQQALTKAFANTTFSADQREEILQLCTRYRSVFSLHPDELGKCTIDSRSRLSSRTRYTPRQSSTLPRQSTSARGHRQVRKRVGRGRDRRTTREPVGFSSHTCSKS